MIVIVKTNESAYVLYQNQKEYCDKFNIKISTKQTRMEHIIKIGFLIGTYVKLASLQYYINEINEKLKIKKGSIDIKKEYTYKKGK